MLNNNDSQNRPSMQYWFSMKQCKGKVDCSTHSVSSTIVLKSAAESSSNRLLPVPKFTAQPNPHTSVKTTRVAQFTTIIDVIFLGLGAAQLSAFPVCSEGPLGTPPGRNFLDFW